MAKISLPESDKSFVQVREEDIPKTGSGDERVSKRSRRASPTASLEEDDPYSLSPRRVLQGGKKAKVVQEQQVGSGEELASESRATSVEQGFSPRGFGSGTTASEQGLSPRGGISRQEAEERVVANELQELSRPEKGQQCAQADHGRGSPPVHSTRKDGKDSGAVSMDGENALKEPDQGGGAGVKFREGEKRSQNNGEENTSKGIGERANEPRGVEGLQSGTEPTEWTTIREDDENPVLASLIDLPSNHRNKTSNTHFEGSKVNEVRNTQAALVSEEDDRQIRALLKEKVAEMTTKVQEMEQQVAEVLRMRSAVMKNKMEGRPGVNIKEGEKDRLGSSNKKQRHFEASRRESAHSKRMADLMRQFSTILRQITQHKWAWPFMSPVDVVALGLHDYFDVIKKPMDLGTIREKINNPKEGAGYRNVQEMCDDVRLVFSNAMLYNQEGTDVHIMAKTLSEKFEEKWKTVLEPKLLEEEAKRLQEQREFESKEAAEFEAAEEAATENLAHAVCRQLVDLEDRLEDLKLQATSRCRTMSIEEKRQLGYNLGRLPPGPLNRVIQIIAKKNPDFNAAAYEVEVDIDAQDPATLWQLHCYVQMVLNPKSNEASGQIPSVSKKKSHHLMPEKLSKKQEKDL